jgi:hypothetical protein
MSIKDTGSNKKVKRNEGIIELAMKKSDDAIVMTDKVNQVIGMFRGLFALIPETIVFKDKTVFDPAFVDSLGNIPEKVVFETDITKGVVPLKEMLADYVRIFRTGKPSSLVLKAMLESEGLAQFLASNVLDENDSNLQEWMTTFSDVVKKYHLKVTDSRKSLAKEVKKELFTSDHLDRLYSAYKISYAHQLALEAISVSTGNLLNKLIDINSKSSKKGTTSRSKKFVTFDSEGYSNSLKEFTNAFSNPDMYCLVPAKHIAANIGTEALGKVTPNPVAVSNLEFMTEVGDTNTPNLIDGNKVTFTTYKQVQRDLSKPPAYWISAMFKGIQTVGLGTITCVLDGSKSEDGLYNLSIIDGQHRLVWLSMFLADQIAVTFDENSESLGIPSLEKLMLDNGKSKLYFSNLPQDVKDIILAKPLQIIVKNLSNLPKEDALAISQQLFIDLNEVGITVPTSDIMKNVLGNSYNTILEAIVTMKEKYQLKAKEADLVNTFVKLLLFAGKAPYNGTARNYTQWVAGVLGVGNGVIIDANKNKLPKIDVEQTLEFVTSILDKVYSLKDKKPFIAVDDKGKSIINVPSLGALLQFIVMNNDKLDYFITKTHNLDKSLRHWGSLSSNENYDKNIHTYLLGIAGNFDAQIGEFISNNAENLGNYKFATDGSIKLLTDSPFESDYTQAVIRLFKSGIEHFNYNGSTNTASWQVARQFILNIVLKWS